MNYYATSFLPEIAAVRVKLLSKHCDKPWGLSCTWYVTARVTSRKHGYFKVGEELTVRASTVYQREGVYRSSRRLYWEGGILSADWNALPESDS